MLFSLIALSPILAEDNQATQAAETTSAQEMNQESNNIRTRQLMSSLEKILTPEQIKNFTNIVKQGNSLYGVRRLATSTATTLESSTSTTTMSSGNGAIKKLEKIAAPWLVNQYEQIKKVGTALWGLKKEKAEENHGDKKSTSTPAIYISSAESTCVINAIKTKDAVLQTNNTNTVAAVNAAIAVRTTCQENAIITTAITASSTAEMAANQRQELALCVQAFRGSAAKIKQDSATQHKTTWDTYRTDLKTCNASSSATIIVEDGGGSILEGLAE